MSACALALALAPAALHAQHNVTGYSCNVEKLKCVSEMPGEFKTEIACQSACMANPTSYHCNSDTGMCEVVHGFPVAPFANKPACDESPCCAHAAAPFPGGVYIGCYVDGWPTGLTRDMAGLCGTGRGNSQCGTDVCPDHGNCCFDDTGILTLEMCYQECAGFKYYGVQNGDGCFCSNTYGSQGKAYERDCSIQCPGNTNQTCGGANRNAVYARGTCRPL